MILKNIKEKVVTVLSSVLAVFQVVLSYLTLCYQTARAFGDCLFQRFPKIV
jgi:hypothetical protein